MLYMKKLLVRNIIQFYVIKCLFYYLLPMEGINFISTHYVFNYMTSLQALALQSDPQALLQPHCPEHLL